VAIDLPAEMIAAALEGPGATASPGGVERGVRR